MPVMLNRNNAFFWSLFRKANPGHPVAAHLDHDPAVLGQQVLLRLRAQQRIIHPAQDAQLPDLCAEVDFQRLLLGMSSMNPW